MEEMMRYADGKSWYKKRLLEGAYIAHSVLLWLQRVKQNPLVPTSQKSASFSYVSGNIIRVS